MSRTVMKQAFDAMSYGNTDEREAARIALREALAQQDAEVHLQAVSDFGQLQAQSEQEPVAWMYVNVDGECEQIEYCTESPMEGFVPLYTSPPQRQPMTDEEILNFGPGQPDAVWSYEDQLYFARAIEAAHGIKSA